MPRPSTAGGGPRARGPKEPPRDPRIPPGADPTRSIYYDPVFNPYGAPPPGMPYKERGPSPDGYHVAKKRKASPPQASTLDERPGVSDDSDDDIVMPAGPPPPRRSARVPRTPHAPIETVAAPVTYTQPPSPPKEQLHQDESPNEAPDEQAPVTIQHKGDPSPPIVLSAGPQMRDLQKETTAFVPPSVQRRHRARGP
ncbi:hypothetical protein MNAN1_001136 [Malassezia nana]|uniref:Uncharacterized protein n=1 Tax=Malassezia nana TaxID=180528 RepID=A0AAF0EI13_9BASI|nr:hypothetical protein MNAN1_001136 [Malassezia nana]